MLIDLPDEPQPDATLRMIDEYLYQLGQDQAREMLPRLNPDQTLVLIHPEDADTFGRGFLDVMGWERVEWRVLWQRVMEIPHVGDASSVAARFVSKPSSPKAACLLQVFNSRLCLLRTQALIALDAGVAPEALHVVSPWMTEGLWQAFKEEIPCNHLRTGGMEFVTDEQMDILMERYAPWREERLRDKRVPRIVFEWMQRLEHQQ